MITKSTHRLQYKWDMVKLISNMFNKTQLKAWKRLKNLKKLTRFIGQLSERTSVLVLLYLVGKDPLNVEIVELKGILVIHVTITHSIRSRKVPTSQFWLAKAGELLPTSSTIKIKVIYVQNNEMSIRG